MEMSTRPDAFRKTLACCRCTSPSASASKQSLARAPFARISASSRRGEACISGQNCAWQSKAAAAPASSSTDVPSIFGTSARCKQKNEKCKDVGRLRAALCGARRFGTLILKRLGCPQSLF